MSIVDQSTKTAAALSEVVQSAAEGVVDLASDSVDAVTSVTGRGGKKQAWTWLTVIVVIVAAAALAKIVLGGDDGSSAD